MEKCRSTARLVAEIHTSQRNNGKLAYDGFIYNRERTRCGTTYWVCQLRGTCSGRATSVCKDGELCVLLGRDHSHDPQHEEVTLMRVRTNLKRKAVEEREIPPEDLVQKELSNLTSDALTLAVREVQNLCRIVDKSRETQRQSDATNAAGLQLSESYFKTISGQQFLLHDNIIRNEVDETTQRTIIFATDDNVRHLFASSIWYANGTFHIVPTMFCQLWTIHGKVNDSPVPLVYIFMQTKKEEEYWEILVRLQHKAVQLNIAHQAPSLVMVDFNKGALNAIKTAFPDAKVSLCIFHYRQSLWRKIQDFSLQAQHSRQDSVVKKWLWCGIGLAYVPPEDVIEVFELLLKDLETIETACEAKIRNFVDHLDRNYVRGRVDVKATLSRILRYPVELWNTYERALTDEMRIDSLMEEWQSKFENTIHDCKWTVHDVVGAIRKEQHCTESALSEASTHQITSVRLEKMSRLNEQLRQLVARYQEFKSAGNIVEYIKTAGSYTLL